MGEHSLGLEIIQFKDPWNFLVKENPDTNKSPEACEFQKMIEAMNLYLNQIMEQGTAPHRPAVKEVCAVLKRETGQWYRVRVESLQPLSAGQQVNCYLIDNGSELTTSVQRFMKLPPKFKDVPPQIKKCCLWGVQPLTLRLVEGECGFDAKSTPSDKWDPSAIQYMSKTIGLSRGCQAEVVEKGLDGTLYVRLYFITKRGLVCFNEKLVEEKYAINVESTDTKNNFHYHHTIANSSGTHTSQHSGICRQDVSSAFEDMPPLVKDISSTSGDIYKSDLDSSHRSEQLEPSVEAFFSKAKEYLSSPESNLFSSPEKASESTSVQTARKEDISAVPSADNQKSFVHSKLAKLSLKQTFKHLDTNDGMKNFTQGRGRGLLKSMGIAPAAESIQAGGLSPKRVPGLSSYDSHSPTFIEKTLSSHPALQIGQSHQNKSMSPQNTSFSISDPIFWGRGARPKGSSSAKINLCETFSKISQGKELSAGISGFQTDPGYSNEIHRAADMDLSEITKRFNIPAKTSDSDSRSSVDSGVRARYRRSVDSGKEKKERDKRAAEVEKSKDDYLRHLPGHNPYSQWSSPPTQLLEALRTRSGQDSPRESEVPSLLVSHHQPTPSPMFGVVVHGVSIPPPKCELSEVPFHERVKQALNGKVETSRSIQAYVWPAVLNCSHVVGIAPPGKGKTMSYIPGLISHLLYPTTYIDLPEGKGPLALIIVPTWRKARDIFEMVGMFEETQKFRLRSIALYAGGTEDNETVQMDLIRGCKVLITTPLSLLRMLDQDFTSLKRVCHVVLDDAEVLASRFKKEVDSIMQLYKLVLQEHRLKNVPRQIMIFASHWDEGVNDFFMRYTRQPIVAISSRVEASVYGGVKQVVIMTKWEQRLVRFCGLLDTLTSTVQKVAAFTSHKTEAVEMWKAAQSRGVYCLLMHHEMPEDELRETRAQWQRSCHTKQLLVIVCTDQCYQDLAITNATSVIHYDLPSSKTKFGNRLVCMLDYFIDRTSDVKPEIEPVSHVILTNKDAVNAQSLYEILERCKADYSTQLCKFLEGYRMGLECDKRKNLCPFLKSFGECINQARCEHRHLLLPEQDLKTGEITHNTLPAEGQVKIQVIRVVNSTRYYCHLIEHQTHPSYPDNVKTELKLEYHRLSFEMVSFFSKEKNRTPYVPSDDPFEDGLCAFMDEDDIFHRAKVIELREGTTTSPMKKCRVWLVDAGHFKNGTVDQLVKLPRRLGEIPYQAVEVYLCCVKPMDNDSEWTDKADIFVHELVEGKQLVGRIMLRVGQTLWLFPLVHQVHIKKIGLATDFNIRQELLSNKFATPNPDHIQSLYKLCRGKTEIPEKIMRQYFDYCLEIEMTQETLSSRVEFHQVDMAAVISPKLFFVHKWENFEVLERLEEKIANTIERKEEEENEEEKSDSSIQLECGSVCLALSEDEKWYRAKIMSESSDDQWEVFFLDYGDREKVPKDKIRPLPRHLAEVPCQAIECELAYIMPKVGDEWPSEAVAIMCDLAYFVNEDKKQLYAKVVERIDPCFGMGQKLVIDLFDTNAADLRFAQELVWKHVAVGIDESVGLKPLLGKPALKNQIFFNPLDKIAFLVANLYWCEDHDEAVELANELHTLLAFRVKGWDIALEKREVLPSVVKVIGYIPDTKSHGIVLDCLTSCCKESTRLCEIAVNENLISGLEHCLEQVSRPEIQYQAVKSVSQLVAQKGFCDYIANSENLLSILESFLKRHQSSTVDLKTLKCLCSASSHLVINNQASSDLRSQEMIDLIISVLTSAGSDIEREPWLELLSSIATWESIHPYIMRESYLPVLLDLLKRCSCEKCLYYLMSICQTLVGGSRKHKKILLENEFLIVLTELLDNGLRSPVLELCQELVSAMALTYPQQEALAGVPVSHLDTTGQIIAPQVTWSQNCFRLLLTIKVRDAKFEDFHITSDKIQCRSNSDGKQYVLDWELYDKVLPDQSTVCPHSSHTIVSLRKDTKGQWDRLLKNKIRPANLSLDFDHPYDSDEEDVNDPENITKLQQKKNIFNQEGMWDVRRIRKYESEEEESSDGLAHYSSNENDEIVFDIESILRAQAQK